jgi:hypothetical protein
MTKHHNPPDDCRQRFVITVDLPGYLGTDVIAANALLNVLSCLEHDGIRPCRTTLKISDTTTP